MDAMTEFYLERIASALERLAPKPAPRPPSKAPIKYGAFEHACLTASDEIGEAFSAGDNPAFLDDVSADDEEGRTCYGYYYLRSLFRKLGGFPDNKNQNGNVKIAFERCLAYAESQGHAQKVIINGDYYIRPNPLFPHRT